MDAKSAARHLAIGAYLWCRWHWETLVALDEVREAFYVLLAVLGLMAATALVSPS